MFFSPGIHCLCVSFHVLDNNSYNFLTFGILVFTGCACARERDNAVTRLGKIANWAIAKLSFSSVDRRILGSVSHYYGYVLSPR